MKGIKTGGRKPGTPNKRTVFLKNELERIGFDWASQFNRAYAENDVVRLRVCMELLQYLVAKPKEREVEPEYIEVEQEAQPDTALTQEQIKQLAKDGRSDPGTS